MKRIVCLIFLSCLFYTFVIGSPAILDSDFGAGAKQIQDTVNSLPVSANGIDIKEIKNYNILGLTKAEERIGHINYWLENNAVWLKVVFGMVPSLTWLFAVNLWLWITGFVYLFLKADAISGIITSLGNKQIDSGLFSMSWNRIFGLIIFFVGFVFSKLIVYVANFVYDYLYILLHYILPYGIIVQIICLICFGSGAFYFISLGSKILDNIAARQGQKREQKDREKEVLNREALDRFSSEAFADA
jgi:hypothetical protein